MKLITSFLVALLFSSSAILASEASTKVAKIDYDEIDDLVESVVLAHPQNKELGERYREQVSKAKALQKKMQDAIMKGEKINPMEAAGSMMHQSNDRKKVEMLCEKHLLTVVESVFGDKYDVILKDDYRSSLIYTKVVIDDVTILIKQELLKQVDVKE